MEDKSTHTVPKSSEKLAKDQDTSSPGREEEVIDQTNIPDAADKSMNVAEKRFREGLADNNITEEKVKN